MKVNSIKLRAMPVSLEIASFLAMTLWVGFFALSAKAQSPGAAIDVQHYTFALQLNDDNNNIRGEATIDTKFLKDVSSFQVDLIKANSAGKGMLVSQVKENGKAISFTQSDETLSISAAAKTNSRHSFTITYSGVPADGLIISTNKFGKRTFFGDNWPNRARNWLPCVDDPADKAAVDFIVTAPAHYEVIANGLKTEEKTLVNQLKLTHWQETALLPTKVMVIGVADFVIEHSGDVNNIPIYSYVFPENKAEGFKSYAIAAQILPFYINKIGPYAYKKLANVQSKTIFGGMENASAIFYFENSVGDKDIEALMAHEIAHQWFGDAVSEKSWAHLWLSEGFATYMTNYYFENKYGEASLKKRLSAQRKKILAFEKTRLTPVVDTAVKSDYMQLLNANSYEKGGWVLYMLRKKMGDDAFLKGLRSYFETYKNSNANTADFKTTMQQASGQNLDVFFKQWLLTAGHPQLSITWKYEERKKMISLHIEQQQTVLYSFPLEFSIDGKLHTENIANKVTELQFPATAPSSLLIDPNVNLLASFEVYKADLNAK